MINFKKIILLIIKIILTIVIFLTLILFLYASFFYEKKFDDNQIINTEGSTNTNIENKEEELELQEKVDNSKPEEENFTEQEETPLIQTEITDALFMTVGNIPITQSDVVNEIKLLLILNLSLIHI